MNTLSCLYHLQFFEHIFRRIQHVVTNFSKALVSIFLVPSIKCCRVNGIDILKGFFLFFCEHPISSIAVTKVLANTKVCDFIIILSMPEDLEVNNYNRF